MALYAFDGTWNSDEDDPKVDTNVVRFRELYDGPDVEYIAGIGTRGGRVGKVLGGLLGMGGHSRIREMYEELCQNWAAGDHDIDIIGFSRGAALAVHFANKLGSEGIRIKGSDPQPAVIRFLGLWDVVGSFGLNTNTIINFQAINLGWHIKTVSRCVQHCYHAMALDERRETFNITRLDDQHEHPNIEEVWFRGVHSDIGGGNGNTARSNIALGWMIEKARGCGLPVRDVSADDPRYAAVDTASPFYENKDVQIDPRRKVFPGDVFHPSAVARKLTPGGPSQTVTVYSALRYNWTGLQLESGASYRFEVPAGDTWQDADIECGPDGWSTEQLPWMKETFVEFFEPMRRCPEANWFELIGSYGDDDNSLFRIGSGASPHTATRDTELYLFANDLPAKYDNNHGSLEVTITRIA